MGVSARRDVVEISSDDEEPEDPRPGKLYASPGHLGWMANLFAGLVVVRGEPASPALPPQKKGKPPALPPQKKGKPRGARAGDGDCVVLEGDPDPPVAVAAGKGSAGGDSSDELEICLFLLFVLNYSFYFAVQILQDRQTGQSRGSGYVIMSTVEEAEMTVKNFHRRELYGRLVTVEKAFAPGARVARAEETSSPYQHRSPSFRIYVGNLPWEVDKAMLKLLFSEYGQVVKAKVVYSYVSGAQRSRGFGFIAMATREASETAIWYLHRQIWKGRELRVRVAKDVPRRGS